MWISKLTAGPSHLLVELMLIELISKQFGLLIGAFFYDRLKGGFCLGDLRKI